MVRSIVPNGENSMLTTILTKEISFLQNFMQVLIALADEDSSFYLRFNFEFDYIDVCEYII